MATMEFRDVVRRRRMVRRYADRPVDPAVLDRMLEHATRAPSAGFSQGWAFLRLDDPEDVARFWRATSPDPGASNAWLDGMRTAPAIVVPLSSRAAYLERYAEPDKASSGRAGTDEAGTDGAGQEQTRWPIPYWHVDTGMAALLILQTAVDEGLGACFFGIPPERVDAFREEFGVPEDHTPIGAITVGHPDEATPEASHDTTNTKAPGGSPTRRPRRPLDEVVHVGNWGTRQQPPH